MIRILTSTTMFLAATGLAHADLLPAPPTQAYTPPASSQCAGETLQVYFPAGTSALTPASRAILVAAQERLDGCVLGPVALNASAADARSETEAETLTNARIETVSAALTRYELVGMHISTEANNTDPAHTVWTPMDRKVEIRLAAWAPEIS